MLTSAGPARNNIHHTIYYAGAGGSSACYQVPDCFRFMPHRMAVSGRPSDRANSTPYMTQHSVLILTLLFGRGTWRDMRLPPSDAPERVLAFKTRGADSALATAGQGRLWRHILPGQPSANTVARGRPPPRALRRRRRRDGAHPDAASPAAHPNNSRASARARGRRAWSSG